MNISVTGTRNYELRKVLKAAAEFYVRQYISERLSKNIKLDIRIKSGLDALGYCTYLDDYNYKPRVFEIELLKDGNVASALVTLAHEIIHLKQYALSELKDGKGLSYKWKKKTYIADDKNHNEYLNMPWEIEAFSNEKKLFTLFKKQYTEYKNFKIE